jgi:hypothetical protein
MKRKILLLRGQYPKDRKDPTEILHPYIEEEEDVWTELLYAMTGPEDETTVLYWGHKYHVDYAPNFHVRMVKELADYKPTVQPDLIIARGGFPEYQDFLKRKELHFAHKVYYGAGERCVPQGFHDYDLVLADSEDQKAEILNLWPHMNVQLWYKPASHIFRVMPGVEKKYDVCYVAVHPEDKRKRCRWVYKTLPPDLTVLQLGNYPKKIEVPKNVTVKNVSRTSMPKAMNKCRAGIVPYTKDDSAPRVVPEMMACGLGVVVLKGIRIPDATCVSVCDKDSFWSAVKARVGLCDVMGGPPPLSISDCASHLNRLLESLWITNG